MMVRVSSSLTNLSCDGLCQPRSLMQRAVHRPVLSMFILPPVADHDEGGPEEGVAVFGHGFEIKLRLAQGGLLRVVTAKGASICPNLSATAPCRLRINQ